MKLAGIIVNVILAAGIVALPGRPAAAQTDAASLIAKSAEAMGGMARLRSVRTLRLEIVYPDHGGPVFQEIRLPDKLRTESPGQYVAVFDGQKGAMLKYDPAKPGTPPATVDMPPEAARGLETDLVWFYPFFCLYPTEYAGTVESGGRECHKLVTTMPLGTRAEYLIDARTCLIESIAVSETYQGQTFRMERKWLDLERVGGLLYPRRMAYPGRGGTTATAELKKVEFDAELGEDRFRITPKNS